MNICFGWPTTAIQPFHSENPLIQVFVLSVSGSPVNQMTGKRMRTVATCTITVGMTLLVKHHIGSYVRHMPFIDTSKNISNCDMLAFSFHSKFHLWDICDMAYLLWWWKPLQEVLRNNLCFFFLLMFLLLWYTVLYCLWICCVKYSVWSQSLSAKTLSMIQKYMLK